MITVPDAYLQHLCINNPYAQKAYECYRHIIHHQPKKFLPMPVIDWSSLQQPQPVATISVAPGITWYDLATFQKLFPEHAAYVFAQQTFCDAVEAFLHMHEMRVLYVAPGVHAEINITMQTPDSINNCVLFIDENAHITVTHEGGNGIYTVQASTIVLKEGAHCRYEYAQRSATIQQLYWTAHLQDNAFFESFYTLFKATDNSTVINLHLHGRHAQAAVNVGYQLKCNQKMRIDTQQHHYQPDSTSTVAVRGILYDAAQQAYTGRIHVTPEAENSFATQEHKNIMLSEYARVWSVPSLEVRTHKVHCKHGSAMGTLDTQQLVYLISRGIDEQRAKELLIDSFFKEIGISNHL